MSPKTEGGLRPTHQPNFGGYFHFGVGEGIPEVGLTGRCCFRSSWRDGGWFGAFRGIFLAGPVTAEGLLRDG